MYSSPPQQVQTSNIRSFKGTGNQIAAQVGSPPSLTVGNGHRQGGSALAPKGAGQGQQMP